MLKTRGRTINQLRHNLDVLLHNHPDSQPKATVASVKDLPHEEAELQFVKIFRELIRLRHVLESFSEFSDDDLALPVQRFADYRSAYLDLFDKVRTDRTQEKASILEDVDFETAEIRQLDHPKVTN